VFASQSARLWWEFANGSESQTYVNHTDGFSLLYGDPNNSPAINTQISTIRKNYFALQNITVDSYLPAVPCPQNYIPGYDAEYTYF
jgi:mannan endo-1,4-beta-mannosidase